MYTYSAVEQLIRKHKIQFQNNQIKNSDMLYKHKLKYVMDDIFQQFDLDNIDRKKNLNHHDRDESYVFLYSLFVFRCFSFFE